jgi:C-terminal processing protease CtpA/Prc
MNKSVVAITISLLAGLAVAAFVLTAGEPQPGMAAGVSPTAHFDQSAAIEDRIRALEAAVAEERNARQLLEDELQNLYTEIDQLNGEKDAARVRDEQLVAANRADNSQIQETQQQRAERASQRQVTRLVNAGFTPERAEWILRRESELQMESLQARFDARQSGQPFNPFDPALNPNTALRAELGDAQYEQYLVANNRPTAVSVGAVFESSPAQRAGLQPGDQVIGYDGTRIFDVSDLNRQAMLGEPGETVVVDFTRDGIPMQVVMPRGPLGVSAGRGRPRR